MTDPGGGYGWRTGRGTGSHRRVAERLEEAPPRALCVLLLPSELEAFALRDRAANLLTAPGVVAVEPARVSYAAALRLPASVGDGLAVTQARRLKLPGFPRVIVIFGALQYPLARGLIAQHPDAELWYWRAETSLPEARGRRRERLEELEIAASHRAALTIDAAPASEPEAPDGELVAVALLGERTDWELARAVAEGMPELVLLAVGGDEAPPLPPNVIRLEGAAATAAVRRADAGLDLGAGRILEVAAEGRRTVVSARPDRPGWERAVIVADGPQAWIAVLRAHAGARARPDDQLREWAAYEANRPLWERLEALGIESGRLGSERRDVTAAASGSAGARRVRGR